MYVGVGVLYVQFGRVVDHMFSVEVSRVWSSEHDQAFSFVPFEVKL